MSIRGFLQMVFRRWTFLIDLLLIITTASMLFNGPIVFLFHLIFILLSVGAFFWSFNAFAYRAVFWVLFTAGMVLRAILLGQTQSTELIEIPMLTAILATVFFIASRRAQSQKELELKNIELQRALNERNRLQEALERQAFYDPLTGLPNRVLFYDRLRHALAHSERHARFVAVLFLDLDGFKTINDQFGHTHGDNVLIQVAERIQSQMRNEDTIARMGGDEFTILLGHETGVEGARQVADRLLNEVSLPYPVHDKEVRLTVSIGIAVNTSGRIQPDELISQADNAMYQIKSNGKAGFKVFDA